LVSEPGFERFKRLGNRLNSNRKLGRKGMGALASRVGKWLESSVSISGRRVEIVGTGWEPEQGQKGMKGVEVGVKNHQKTSERTPRWAYATPRGVAYAQNGKFGSVPQKDWGVRTLGSA
jgi:hypothetical protein